MPFRSKAQQRWMFWAHPKMAERWAHETPNIKDLPERVKSKKYTVADIFKGDNCSCGADSRWCVHTDQGLEKMCHTCLAKRLD